MWQYRSWPTLALQLQLGLVAFGAGNFAGNAPDIYPWCEFDIQLLMTLQVPAVLENVLWYCINTLFQSVSPSLWTGNDCQKTMNIHKHFLVRMVPVTGDQGKNQYNYAVFPVYKHKTVSWISYLYLAFIIGCSWISMNHVMMRLDFIILNPCM